MHFSSVLEYLTLRRSGRKASDYGAKRFLFIYNVHRAPRHYTYGDLNQPSPRFQADRLQSVKVYGHIEGHSNLMQMLILLKVTKLEVLTVVDGLVTILRLTLVKADLILMTGEWC
jgi:hypothetical protein